MWSLVSAVVNGTGGSYRVDCYCQDENRGFLLGLLDPRIWDRYVVPKRRYTTTTQGRSHLHRSGSLRSRISGEVCWRFGGTCYLHFQGGVPRRWMQNFLSGVSVNFVFLFRSWGKFLTGWVTTCVVEVAEVCIPLRILSVVFGCDCNVPLHCTLARNGPACNFPRFFFPWLAATQRAFSPTRPNIHLSANNAH
jgi:hypothetical protein